MSRSVAGIMLFALLVGATACTTRAADPSYCGVAQTGYKNSLAELNQRLSQYSSCVARSTGSAACASEFADLRSAQANLETSAGDVARYCPAKP